MANLVTYKLAVGLALGFVDQTVERYIKLPPCCLELCALLLHSSGKSISLAQTFCSSVVADILRDLHAAKLWTAHRTKVRFFAAKVTRENLEDTKNFARVLHEKRLAGLYVENSEGGLKIPADAISREECDNLIRLA
jgi:hypothetical protein